MKLVFVCEEKITIIDKNSTVTIKINYFMTFKNSSKQQLYVHK